MSKPGACPSEDHLKGFLNIFKYQTGLEELARDKHFSFSNKEKSFITLTLGLNVVKLFLRY